jgi:hypothetical protein
MVSFVSSGIANVSLLFDPMGLSNDDELVDVSLAASTQEAVVEGKANSIPHQSVNSVAKDAEVSKSSSVSASSLSGMYVCMYCLYVVVALAHTYIDILMLSLHFQRLWDSF